jgi:methylmalonyl-CoA mutase cobalamin-binding subunit
VRAIARDLVSNGTRLVDLVRTVFVPPLRRIGQAWHDGELSIWVEHRASAIVERTLGELSPNPRGRRRGLAMVAAVSGDRHSLPTTMAAVVLREANWQVHHLGADMPGDELVQFCAEHDIDVAVISLTNPAVVNLAATTAERIRRMGTAAILGGPGRSLDDLVAAAKAATSAREIVEKTGFLSRRSGSPEVTVVDLADES